MQYINTVDWFGYMFVCNQRKNVWKFKIAVISWHTAPKVSSCKFSKSRLVNILKEKELFDAPFQSWK